MFYLLKNFNLKAIFSAFSLSGMEETIFVAFFMSLSGAVCSNSSFETSVGRSGDLTTDATAGGSSVGRQ